MSAPLSAVVARDARSAASLPEALGFLGERVAGSRTLALNMAPAVFPPVGSAGLLYASADVRELYDLIAVDAAVNLYPGAWTSALLLRLIDMLAAEGELVLPFVDPPDRRLTLEAITSLLGVEPAEVVGHHARFRPSAPPAPPPSIMTWATNDFAAIVHAFLLARTLRRSTDVLMLDDMLLEVLADGAERVMSVRRELGRAGFDGGDGWFEDPGEPAKVVYSAEYEQVARIIASHLVAAGRRAALVRAVMNAHEIGAAGPALDLGGRYGFLAAELALDAALGADPALACDVSTAYLASALQIYRAHRPLLHGRYQFCLGRLADFAPPPGQQVICLCGSLLDVDARARSQLLVRAREALCERGLLIVEQPLDPGSGITDDELDRMLRQLGTLRMFTPHSFIELDATDTQPGSVRVVAA